MEYLEINSHATSPWFIKPNLDPPVNWNCKGGRILATKLYPKWILLISSTLLLPYINRQTKRDRMLTVVRWFLGCYKIMCKPCQSLHKRGSKHKRLALRVSFSLWRQTVSLLGLHTYKHCLYCWLVLPCHFLLCKITLLWYILFSAYKTDHPEIISYWAECFLIYRIY